MKHKRPFVIGLTGSIGMGKTTTAKMFADEGVAVWDADAAVARLYAKGSKGVAAVKQLCGDAIVDGAVDRARLREWIARDASALAQIEAVVHPLVAADRAGFLAETDHEIVVLDIPLLFETGGQEHVDMVVVVSATPETQRTRVLARPGMTTQQFELILSKQMPDAEKQARADRVIRTDTLAGAQQDVQKLIAGLRGQLANA